MVNLNDKVIVKSDSAFGKNVGTVKAIFDASYYYELIPNAKVDLDNKWSTKFPDWKNKTVLTVLFNVNVKVASEDEWNNSLLKQNSNLDYSNCPSTNFMIFPEDDLERIIL